MGNVIRSDYHFLLIRSFTFLVLFVCEPNVA